MTDHDEDRAQIEARLNELIAEKAQLEARLVSITRPARVAELPQDVLGASVTARSSAPEKIALFKQLFAGRHDVFPLRWHNANTGKSGYAPACANEWVRGTCDKPRIKCGECPNQAFIPFSDDVVTKHLRGADRARQPRAEFVAGVYPLLSDETCWFLAADFDGDEWSTDALAYLASCRAHGVPAALERSRSGNGGHVWVFFRDLTDQVTIVVRICHPRA